MKRIIFSAVLLISILWISYFSTTAIRSKSEEIVATIESGDIAQANALWNDASVLYGSLLRHDELNNVETLFLRVESAMQTEDTDEQYYATCELSDSLMRLVDVTVLNVRNIL